MAASDETIIRVTPNAPWLPPGGLAEVIRCTAPHQPMAIVRLLLRRGHLVFCTPRPETGKLDLPMALTEAGDATGTAAIRALANHIVGPTAETHFLGAVRNTVDAPGPDYAWPVPVAHFGVWTSAGEPLVDGSWIPTGDRGSQLSSRHWYPLL